VSADLATADRIGDVRGDGDEVGRAVGWIEVDVVFQRGQREGGGCVDDRDPTMIPAAAGLPRALAVEGRIRPAADPPDPGQL
jgi:hypothetical protein